MACLGVFFAVTQAEAKEMRSLPDDESCLEYLQEVIEERYFSEHPEFLAETGKAWDALHRALADGELTWTGGAFPLNHAVLAGESLYTQQDYILTLKTPQQVQDIAAALTTVSEDEFRKRYFAIDPVSYELPLTEDDFAYTWYALETVRDFYDRAASAGRYVLFTVDQ